jgi:hypothetical protein
MSAHGSYSVVVVNQPKKIITNNTKQTKYLKSVPQESNIGEKIKALFTYIIWHLLIMDLAVWEPSWCAPSRSIRASSGGRRSNKAIFRS